MNLTQSGNVANRLRFGCESQVSAACWRLLVPILPVIAFTVAWRSLGKLLSI
jgi:hypothetical protein